MRNTEMTILITSAGRRVGLMECFRDSLRQLGIAGSILVTDCSRAAPAMYRADKAFPVARLDSPELLPQLVRIIQERNVRLLVPTIDIELRLYAQHRAMFEQLGVHAALSSAETVRICRDKVETHRWLVEQDLPTVKQGSVSEVLSAAGTWKFPVIAKPRSGSASAGIRWVSTPDELMLLAGMDEEFIVQERAAGLEYTVNVFVDRDARCRCAVPHRRIETRGGEVSKAAVTRHPRLIDLASQTAERLPGAYGPLNVQGFLDDKGEFRIIEINCRFGGGYPLAHHAGAHFTRWLVEDALGLERESYAIDWNSDIVMLRYDEAIFVSAAQIG